MLIAQALLAVFIAYHAPLWAQDSRCNDIETYLWSANPNEKAWDIIDLGDRPFETLIFEQQFKAIGEKADLAHADAVCSLSLFEKKLRALLPSVQSQEDLKILDSSAVAIDSKKLLETALAEINNVQNKIRNPQTLQKSSLNLTKEKTAIQNIDQKLALIAETLKAQIKRIQDKFLSAQIPSCVITTELLPCMTDGAGIACEQALWNLWSQSSLPGASSSDGKNEFFIKDGNFYHLLLSQAITCNGGIQKGDTCGIYSSNNIMSHYCETPRRNPLADEDTCAAQGPTFCCPSTQAMLERATKIGAWKATKYNTLTGEETPSLTGDDAGADELNLGKTGMYPLDIERLYQEYGFKFKPIPIEFSESGLDQVIKRLNDGHPVQAGIWPGDSLDGHVLIIEGIINGQWFMLRDSNLEDIHIVSRPKFFGQLAIGSGPFAIEPDLSLTTLPRACQ